MGLFVEIEENGLALLHSVLTQVAIGKLLSLIVLTFSCVTDWRY